MSNVDDLWGYNPEEPVSDEARRVYGLIFPLFHEYVVNKLLDDHVVQGRRDAARNDVVARLDRLVDEALFCVATGVPDAAGTWWIEHRRHRFEVRHRDLRRRRRKLPDASRLLQEFDPLRDILKEILSRRRRGQPISDRSLETIQELFPQLGWRNVADSLDKTPAETAHKILSDRYGTSPRRVKTVLKQARRTLRS